MPRTVFFGGAGHFLRSSLKEQKLFCRKIDHHSLSPARRRSLRQLGAQERRILPHPLWTQKDDIT